MILTVSSVPNYYSLLHCWALSASAHSGAFVGQPDTIWAGKVVALKQNKGKGCGTW